MKTFSKVFVNLFLTVIVCKFQCSNFSVVEFFCHLKKIQGIFYRHATTSIRKGERGKVTFRSIRRERERNLSRRPQCYRSFLRDSFDNSHEDDLCRARQIMASFYCRLLRELRASKTNGRLVKRIECPSI